MRPGAVDGFVPLAILLPILLAGLVLIVGRWVPRTVVDLVAIATAAAVTALTGVIAAATLHGRAVSWAGGWRPTGGVSVGVVLVADPLGAGLACLAGVLTVGALLYSWRYLEDAQAHYHALVLVFLAGMTGFALSGDLFNMFVFFELMSAVAYALTGLHIEEPESVQGGFTFAVVNSLGAYLTLVGIGLLYARTGALGLAQVGTALSGHRADALVVAAFVLVNTGFLVKAAMVPMHFWLADAHAVAPAPVCALMSGVMVELGVYAVARANTVVFGASIPHPVFEHAFVALGVLTAVTGAVMCLGQRHLKRLLAYSTIAHVGLFLVAAGIGDPASTAGTALYVAGHAGVKGALFLLVGLLLNRFSSVDEIELYARGGGPRDPAGWLFVLGGLALAGIPPFGPGLGKAIAEEAAITAGLPWLPVLFVLVSAATGGAVLRAGARVFLGWGRRPEPPPADRTSGAHTQPDTERATPRTPLPMLTAIVLLLGAGLAVGVFPAFGAAAARGAMLFTDRAGYLTQTLAGATDTPPGGAVPGGAVPAAGWTGVGVLLGVLSAVLAVAIAGLYLHGARARGPLVRLTGVMVMLHRLHSGHVGDYVAWLFAGSAIVAALIGLPLL